LDADTDKNRAIDWRERHTLYELGGGHNLPHCHKKFQLITHTPPRPQADEQEYHINHLPNDWYDFPYILIHFYSLLYIDLDTWL